MKLSSAKGLMKNAKVIASKTEEEIFKELGLDYIKPENRN
jgi:DNA polymerase/3'-5' exonuclease PolX